MRHWVGALKLGTLALTGFRRAVNVFSVLI